MKTYSIRSLLLALTVFTFFATTGCSSHPTERPKVKIGIQMSPAMTLVMVAKDHGFFDAEGVDVDLQGFTAGKFALQAFLGGSLDFAIAGEVPVTLAALQGNRLAVVSQVVAETRNEVRVIARRDSTATDARTYFHAKRRTIATSFGGGPEFFTYNFLKQYGLTTRDVQLIPLKPEEMIAAVKSGSVDAVSIFDPFAFLAEQQMGAEGVTFTGNLYSELYVLVCKPQDIQARGDVLARILRALHSAEADIREHPDAAQQVVAKYTELQSPVIRGIWGNFVFAPALTQNLLTAMTAEGHWAQDKGDVPATAALPDFRQVIADGPLRAVVPTAVQVH